MLPKKNRADKTEIDLLFKEGKFLNSQNLTFKYIKNRKFLSAKISFVAPKSVARLAVKRNLLRRRGYRVLQKYLDQFPAGTLGVFVFKKYQDDILLIENEIKNILSKIN